MDSLAKLLRQRQAQLKHQQTIGQALKDQIGQRWQLPVEIEIKPKTVIIKAPSAVAASQIQLAWSELKQLCPKHKLVVVIKPPTSSNQS